MKRRKRILVFMIGQLGDTLTAVPALWVVRRHFAGGEITLLCDEHPGKDYVQAMEVLGGGGFFNAYEIYPISAAEGGTIKKIKSMVRLLRRLRERRYDVLVYLAPTTRKTPQRRRDLWFFRAAGIKHLLGTEGYYEWPVKKVDEPLSKIKHESDQLLERLARSGLEIPSEGGGRMGVNVTEEEERAVERWRGELPSDGGRIWVAVGAGSKMKVKRWPRERYAEVVKRLIEEYDIWPVVFGGKEDEQLARSLVEDWGRGYVAAGRLSVREGIAAMGRCAFYLGNDTGTMHMAVAAGLKCAAVFSARNPPGLFFPYGEGHRVFRKAVECEGCRLVECERERMKCVLSITVEEVHKGCRELWGERCLRRTEWAETHPTF